MYCYKLRNTPAKS